MKQNITIEQLNELSEGDKKGLVKWIDKKSYWIYKQVGSFDLKGELPLLSIGQLIEFLDEHADGNDINIRIHSAGLGWQKTGQRLVDIDGLHLNEIEDEVELCDALWDACMQVLEK